MSGTHMSGRRKKAKNAAFDGLEPLTKIPNPPEGMDPQEIAIFKLHAGQLIKARTLTDGDLAGLVVFTRLYASIERLEAIIKAVGCTYTSDGIIRQRPEIRLLSDARKDLKAYISLLGLSPTSRRSAEAVKISKKFNCFSKLT